MKYIFFLVTILFLLVPGQVAAQNISLSMTPPIIELTIKPGKSVVIAYTVSNLGDPAVLSSNVRPFAPSGIYGELNVAQDFSGPIRFNLENSNIKFDTPFFLQTKQGQQLLLKIRVPEGTPEGDYYYTFLATNAPGKLAEGSSQPVAQASIGSNILITVTNAGNFDINPRISQFKMEPRYVFNLFGRRYNLIESSDAIPVSLTVENKGKNLIKPHGSVTLKGTFGTAKEYTILPENILSNSSRLLHATPSGSLDRKRASLIIDGFHVGKYTLRSSVNFGLPNQNIGSSVVFYAVPIKFIAATLVAILIGSIIIKKFNSGPEDEEDDTI